MASIDLIFDTKTQKILFAEAKKDFIDFLVSLLTLPMATIIGLLTKSSDIGMVGCLGSLYNSIENMSEFYLQPRYKKNKGSLLKPKALLEVPRFLLNVVKWGWPKLYTCPNYDGCASDDTLAICPHCDEKMDVDIEYVDRYDQLEEEEAKEEEEKGSGFVKHGPTFLIRDDLYVEPMSIPAVFDLLTQFNKTGRSDELQCKSINISLTEGLKLLQASFQCKTVLNTVLLHHITGQ